MYICTHVDIYIYKYIYSHSTVDIYIYEYMDMCRHITLVTVNTSNTLSYMSALVLGHSSNKDRQTGHLKHQ